MGVRVFDVLYQSSVSILSSLFIRMLLKCRINRLCVFFSGCFRPHTSQTSRWTTKATCYRIIGRMVCFCFISCIFYSSRRKKTLFSLRSRTLCKHNNHQAVVNSQIFSGVLEIMTNIIVLKSQQLRHISKEYQKYFALFQIICRIYKN